MDTIIDAHVHVGYFPRLDQKGGEAYYYSPARVMQYMKWAGIREFIFSSTNACWDVHGEAMHPEAVELLRLASLSGMKAHPFFWVSWEYFQWDPDLSRVPKFYEGIKLHGGEAHWTDHPQALRSILGVAGERGLPVQIHTSADDINGCQIYLPFILEVKDLRVDLAHGHPVSGALQALKASDRIWVDISFMEEREIEQILAAAPERIMYGSDFPAPLRYSSRSCTDFMRRRLQMARRLGGEAVLYRNAQMFLSGK